MVFAFFCSGWIATITSLKSLCCKNTVTGAYPHHTIQLSRRFCSHHMHSVSQSTLKTCVLWSVLWKRVCSTQSSEAEECVGPQCTHWSLPARLSELQSSSMRSSPIVHHLHYNTQRNNLFYTYTYRSNSSFPFIFQRTIREDKNASTATISSPDRTGWLSQKLFFKPVFCSSMCPFSAVFCRCHSFCWHH